MKDPAKPQKTLQKPRVEVSAGALIFKRTARGVFLAMVADSYGNWTFPKGHVRRGESFQEAAKRESMEETGVTGLTCERKLGTIDIWFRDRFVQKGALVHKFIHYFLFEAPSHARLRVPKRVEDGERIGQVAWVPFEKVTGKSHYKDMVPIVGAAVAAVAGMKPSREL